MNAPAGAATGGQKMNPTATPQPGAAVTVQTDEAAPSSFSQMVYDRDTAEQEIRSIEFSAGFHRGRRKAADENGDTDLSVLHDAHFQRAEKKLRDRREMLKGVKRQLDALLRRAANS